MDKVPLRDDARLVSAVLGAVGALIVILDRRGRIVRFNKTCEAVTGYTFDEVHERQLWDLFLTAEEVGPVKAVFAKLAAGTLPSYHENYWRTKGGDLRFISWSNTVLLDAAGAVEYVVGTGIDITDRKQAEERMRMALDEARQRTVETEALLAGTSAVLKHDKFEDAARAIFDTCKELIGARAGYVALLNADHTENDVVFLDAGGVPCSVDPSLPMPIRGLRAKASRAQKPVCEKNFAKSPWVKYMPPGHAVLESVLFAPLVIEGKTEGLIGLANKPGGFTDDDVRLAAAFAENAAVALYGSRLMESLKSSEEQFRSVAETATDAVICVNSRGKITFWNTAAESIFGYMRDGVEGKSLEAIMPKRFRAPHKKGLERLVSTGKSEIIGSTLEVAGLRRDGTEFPLELSLSRWKTSDGVFFTGMIRDISERKETERLSEALNAINETIGSTLDADKIMERIVVEAGKAIGCDTTSISMREGDSWVVRYVDGVMASQLMGLSLTDDELPQAVLAAKIKKPIAMNDAYRDDRVNERIMRKHRLRSALIVPLVVKDEAIGALSFNYHAAPIPFTGAQMDFAAKLATSTSLALENARLYQQEHRIAQTLQADLLRPFPEIPGLDIGIVYASAFEAELVGGDFYDIFEVGENLFAVLIGDVSGKGIKAAGLTETIRSSVRTLAYIDPSPAFVFNRLNQSLMRQLTPGYFATAILLVLDTVTKEIRIAGAGHPLPVLCDGACGFIDVVPGALLGVVPTTYRESYLKFDGAQMIVLYTDGLIEARRGKRFFGQQRLLKTVCANEQLSPQEMADRLLAAATEFAQGRLADDAAIVALRLADG